MTDPAIQTPQELFFEQIGLEIGHSPILHQLHCSFRNRQDAIWQMKEAKPSDETLLAFISNAFGIWGGGGRPEGWYEYKGGKNPHLLIQNRQFEITHKLEGKQLVNAFRQIYRVQGDQLSLF